jgi:AraC-like DNA-binding protein
MASWRKIDSDRGSLQVERIVVPLEGNLLRMDHRFVAPGEHLSRVATGAAWIFSLVWPESGEVDFPLRDGAVVRPSGKSFGLFIPPFSVVGIRFRRAVVEAAGLMSEAPLPGFTRPLIFEPPPGVVPYDLADVRDVLEARKDSLYLLGSLSALCRRAKAKIDEEYKRPIPMAEVAAALNTSPATLSRAFRREIGLTPLAYRHRLQVMDAIVRLGTGAAIADTSGEVGFGDLGRFYKAFRRTVRSSPGPYRFATSIKNRQDSPPQDEVS